MIRHINTGPFLEVQNGSTPAPFVNNHNGQAMNGMVRYVNNRFEVYDGHSWLHIGEAYPTINLTESAVKAIEWSLKNMEFEAELEKMAETNPAIKAAHEQLKRAADQLKATIILSRDEETTS